MYQEIYLSVIVPAYNEAERLPKTLKEIDDYLRKQSYASEIIVVNDGSTDKTAEVINNLVPGIKNLKNLGFKKRRGKGFVVKRGILESRGRFRIFTDADNSTTINHVEKMWSEFERGYSVVIGSRSVNGKILIVPQSLARRILGQIFKMFRKILIGFWEIEDTQCGFKGFSAEAAENIFSRIIICHFGFDVESLVIAKKLGYKIKEIPVRWVNYPQSKVKFKNMIEMFLEY